MAAKLSIFHKGLILILSPILLESIVLLGLYSVLSQTEQQQALEARYKERSASVIKMSSLTFEACMLLFAVGVSGQAFPKAVFEDKMTEVRKQADLAQSLMESDQMLRPIFNPLHKVQHKALDMLSDLGDTVSKGSGAAVLSQLQETIDVILGMMINTGHLVEKFIGCNDERIAESTAFIQELQQQHFNILICAVAGNTLLALILMWYFNNSILQRLGIILRNTDLLRSGKTLPEALQGSDEIALLDQSFHSMDHALKDAQRKERLLFDNAADVICIVDSSNCFVKLNPASIANWGADPALLTGKSIESIVYESDIEKTLQQLQNCRETGQASFFENRVIHAINGPVEFHWSVYFEPVENKLYCVAHDISTQKEIDRARERYISIVSNDLQKPIASISEAFEAMKSVSGLPDKAKEKLSVVTKNLQRLLFLVQELSKRKSFSAGDGQMEIGTTNTAELLERSTADVEGLARSRQIKITCQAAPIELQADSNRLIQVLVNLLSNAIKFSADRTEIVLSAEDKGNTLEISIRDHGRGIPEDQLQNVFEKFKQVEGSDGKRSAGTGLGLPICKQIVEQHGGNISVESKVNEGSTFKITLPKKYNPFAVILDDSAHKPELSEKTEISQILPTQGPPTLAAKWQKLPLIGKGAILVGVPLLFEVILVGTLTFFFLQSESLAKDEILQRQIANDANGITFCYRRMAIAVLNPNQQGQKDLFTKNREETFTFARHLRTLVKNDPHKKELMQKIIKQIKICNRNLEESYAVKLSSGENQPQFLSIGVSIRLMKPLGILTHQLQELVQDSTKKGSFSPKKQKLLQDLQVDILVGGLLINIVIGLALAKLFSNDIRKRLVLVADNTSRMAREVDLNPPLGGTDEIAVLDATFHKAAAELNTARKRERTLFDNSKEIICSFDENGKMTGVNPAATNLLGYSKEALLSTEFLSLVSDDDRQATRENLFSDHVASPVSPTTFENRVTKADGSVSELQWSATRAAGEKEIFCVAHDISVRKEAERLRNEFLSIVSHDLRTPLAGILVTTAMLEEGGFGVVPPQALQQLATVASDVHKLLELINDLLDIEKLEAGMMSFTISQVELKELSSEFAEKSKKLLADKNIILKWNASDTILSLDKERFAQALSNLLINAIERSPEGSSIDISARQDKETYSLIIRDHAAPLDSQTRKNIFDRYAISSQSSATKISSLAVPLSKSIIKLHGGTLEMSENPQINEFILMVPLPVKTETNAVL